MKITRIVLIIALLLIFAACGTDDSPSPPESVAESEPVEEPADEEPVEEPADEEPVEEPADEEPVEEPADEEPVEEPADEVPVEEPADEVPVEEPADEEPVEEPADEEPVEEPGSESGDGTPMAGAEPEDPAEYRPMPLDWSPWMIPSIPLYALFGVPGCEESPPAELPVPGITAETGGGEFGVICLYGFELDERIDVELYTPHGSPAGSSSIMATVDSSGMGQVQVIPPDPDPEPLRSEVHLTEPVLISLGIWLPAGVPHGEWLVQARSPSHDAAGTLLVPEERSTIFDKPVPWISTSPTADINPFQSYHCADYEPGERVYIQGIDLNPGSTFYVAIYLSQQGADASLVDKILVTSDENGRFQTEIAADGYGQDPATLIVAGSMPEELWQGRMSPILPWFGCYNVSTTAAEPPEPTPTYTAEPPPESTYTPEPVLPVHDCLPYDPAQLAIVDEGSSGWLLTDGRSRMKMLANEADARDTLALAQRHTAQCFIGRDNNRTDRMRYIMRYWTGDSGIETTIAQVDCLPYNKDGLNIVDEGENGWLLMDGRSRMKMLDNEDDARIALQVAQASTYQCFIGRGNDRPNRLDYIVTYWK